MSIKSKKIFLLKSNVNLKNIPILNEESILKEALDPM